MEYEPIIGLEVHIELATQSKMFCGCSADYFGKEPNTLTCPVCLGLPGALPVPNRKAVEWTLLLGLALKSQINRQSKFDRKNYFYPDLPKGYQISQYDQPIAVSGKLKMESGKLIRIRRVHLEEDTGKLLHSGQIANYDGPAQATLIDFNRSGVPLVEVVTEPDFRSSGEAKEFLKKVQLLVRYLNISDADMEKGSMRIEPSVSLRETAVNSQLTTNNGKEDYPNYRVEIKNINSFRFAQKAIDYEIKRQTEILEKGGKVDQETRGWNEAKVVTVGQRTKEEAHDYRYFPEPDIPPMVFEQLIIDNLKLTIPELPEAKIRRYIKELGVKESDAKIIIVDVNTARYFEEAVVLGSPKGIEVQKIANLIVNKKIEVKTTSPIQLIESLSVVTDQSSILGREELDDVCQKVIRENTPAVTDLRAGKASALQFLVGQVMKETKGQTKALKVSQILTNLIKGN